MVGIRKKRRDHREVTGKPGDLQFNLLYFMRKGRYYLVIKAKQPGDWSSDMDKGRGSGQKENKKGNR